MITLSSLRRGLFGFAILILLSAAHLRQVCAEETSKPNNAAVAQWQRIVSSRMDRQRSTFARWRWLGPCLQRQLLRRLSQPRWLRRRWTGQQKRRHHHRVRQSSSDLSKPANSLRPEQYPRSCLNALVQAVAQNSGTRLLNSPPENDNFEINISSDMPQQCDNPSQSNDNATAASNAKPAANPSSSTTASDTNKDQPVPPPPPPPPTPHSRSRKKN